MLYGSFARGDATDASDINVLVVLRGEVERLREIERISEMAYPLELKNERSIGALPISQERYEDGDSPLLASIQREGLVL